MKMSTCSRMCRSSLSVADSKNKRSGMEEISLESVPSLFFLVVVFVDLFCYVLM